MVQLAELDAGRDTIEAALNYFVDARRLPASLIAVPGASDQRIIGGSSETR
jgi:hypothetical protein